MDSNRSPGRENDPEQIDLIDLAMQLWHGVATIIVFILAGILAAVGQLEAALRYAEAAGIDKPHTRQTQYVTPDTMFLLGKDALKSMTDNEATRPLIFSDDYYQMKQKLLDIRALKPGIVHPYRCIMKPRLPVRRDSPKTAVTLVLAVLLGGMAGAGVVLGRNALRHYKAT